MRTVSGDAFAANARCRRALRGHPGLAPRRSRTRAHHAEPRGRSTCPPKWGKPRPDDSSGSSRAHVLAQVASGATGEGAAPRDAERPRGAVSDDGAGRLFAEVPDRSSQCALLMTERHRRPQRRPREAAGSTAFRGRSHPAARGRRAWQWRFAAARVESAVACGPRSRLPSQVVNEEGRPALHADGHGAEIPK